MIWYRLLRWLKLAALSLVFIVLIAPEWPAFGQERYQLQAIIGQRQFDFLVWETKATEAKVEAMLANDQVYLDTDTRRQIVLNYLELLGEAQRLEASINEIYADTTIANPGLASRPLQQELGQKRRQLARWQPTAEAIVQEQVAAVLVNQGFSLLGQAWPPVLMHMTPLPSLLIVSPRQRIERIYGISLQHGLSTPAKEAMETAVFDQLDRSALVVPIGGMGTYPAMIVETNSINWLVEVTAHEWTHHWLTLKPLGWYYATDADARTINETVASMVDQEIAKAVIERYYPAFVPLPPAEIPPRPETPPHSDAPPAFDFRAEMAQTRIRVDELLAEGKVEEAEAYMEARRRLFVEQGFLIRKLNQAYFAFYGAYAAEPGATGADPIGPMLQQIRAHSPSLRAFLENVAPVTSFVELRAVLERLTAESTAGE